MKIRILKIFWQDNQQYFTGDVADVSPNMAHGLIESGLAKKYIENDPEFPTRSKAPLKPPRDKMIDRKKRRNKIRIK